MINSTEASTKHLLKRGYNDFKIIEGIVALSPYDKETQWVPHTWIEFKNGRIFNPAQTSLNEGYNPNDIEYKKVTKVFSPSDYLYHCKWENGEVSEEIDEVKEISYAKMMKKILLERMTFKQLLSRTDPLRISKSRTDVTAKSIRVQSMNGNEAWTFTYKSSPSTTGQRWHGYVKFLKEDVSDSDRADDLDCMVDCDCPDYRYRFAYNNAKAGAGALGADAWNDNNGQPPRPRSQGGVGNLGEGLCKHLSSLSKFLKTYIDPVSPEHDPAQMPVAQPPIKQTSVQTSKKVLPVVKKPITTIDAPKEPSQPKVIKPLKKPSINPPKTSSDAPDPDDTYNDDRDEYSDSRGLNEGRDASNKLDKLTQSNPEFEIFYEDNGN